ARHEDVSTVMCAPVYSEVLKLTTEVVLGPEDGLRRICAARCDFLTLIFKSKLTNFIATLSPTKTAELDRALAFALELPIPSELQDGRSYSGGGGMARLRGGSSSGASRGVGVWGTKTNSTICGAGAGMALMASGGTDS